MRRYLYLSLMASVLLAILSGCTVRNTGAVQASYVLDMNAQLLCVEGGACLRIGLIEASYRKSLIAEAYGLPRQYYGWDSQALVDLMLNPPEGLYRVERLADYVYRLPPVFATHSVWDVLALEHYELYERDADSNLLERLPPPSRRW